MNPPFLFYTDSLTWHTETKENGQKRYYVEGYASTSDMDLVNDIVTSDCLKDMLSQLKGRTIKIDVEHESWKEGGSPNIIPVGRVVDARLDEKGLWVKCEMNSAVSRFDEVWKSIEGKFLDAFSIAFNNVKAVERVINGVKTRLITGLYLLNIAITGNPANPACRMTGVLAKSREFAQVEHKEEPHMADETPAPAPEKPVAEAKSFTVEDFERLQASVAEMKAASEKSAALAEQVKAQEDELKSLKEALNASVIKTQAPAEKPSAPQASPVNPLDLFR